MPSTLEKRLSKEALKTYIHLLEQAQFYPHKVFDEVKEFYENHSDLPEAMNLLTYLYIQKKQIAKAEELTEENYKKNPDYLFARINYADQCLRKKQPEKVAEIFPSFHLKELYPKREVFHFAEFRGFMVTLGFYYLALKNKKKSKECLDFALQADPDHSSVKLLQKKLRPNLLLRLMHKLNDVF
jgi:tetratricopeptide (TPR) repeat protein